MVLNKRVLRTIKENKLRYLGVLMLIILGSFTFILATGISQNLSSLVTVFTEEHMQEDLSFTSVRAVNNSLKSELANDAIIEEYFSFDATISETLTLRLLSKTDKLNIPAVVEGQTLTGKGEILLDPAFAKANGYTAGSSITAGGKTYNVVGFVSLPHYIYPLKNVNDMMVSPNNFGVGVIAPEDFDDINNPLTVYSVRFKDRGQSLNMQAAELRQRLQAEGIATSDWVDIVNNKRANMVWASITGMKTMSIPIPTAMFLLCCLIISIIIWRMIRNDLVIIGTFYAEGYRRKELLFHYMAIPLLLAIAGGVIGSALALLSIKPAVIAMISYYNVPVPKIQLNALNSLVAILLPVLFLGISSYAVIGSELRRSPAELMKGDIKKTKVSLLEGKFRLERFKFTTKFKLRQQLRSVSRLMLLFLGITSASVLMLLGFTIMNSMNYIFNNSTTDTYKFEYEYAFKDLQYDEAPEGAEVFAAGRFYPEGKENIEFYVTGVEPDSKLLALKSTAGSPLPNNQVNITKPLADRLGIRAGDSVSFVNKDNSRLYTFRINSIADSYAGQFIFMPIGEFNQQMELPENSYNGLWSNRILDIPDEMLSGMKSMGEAATAIDELMGPMISMVMAMTVIASIVGLIIIYLVTSLIIEENRNTISLFKIFGYRPREIKSLILNSSTFIIMTAFVISIPIMAGSMEAMYGYLGNMINLVLPTIINPLYVFICFIAIMLTYQLSKLLCARKVTSVSMSEALKAGGE